MTTPVRCLRSDILYLSAVYRQNKPILVPLLTGECNPTVQEPRTKTGKIEGLWACAKDADEGLEIVGSQPRRSVFCSRRLGNEEVNGNLKDKILVRNSSHFEYDNT